MHAQRGKVIGFVAVVVVVISTKITKSLELGVFASYNCRKMQEISKKMTLVSRCLIKATKGVNHANRVPLTDTPIYHTRSSYYSFYAVII